MQGSLKTPRPRGWKGRFGGFSNLGTQVERLLELFFLLYPLNLGRGINRGSAGVALNHRMSLLSATWSVNHRGSFINIQKKKE